MRVRWQKLAFISVFALLALVACQGTESITSSPAVVPTGVVAGASGIQPEEVVTPTPVKQVSIADPEEDESLGKKPDMTLDRIAYINSNGDLLTINPDGTEIRALTSGVQANAGSTGGVMAQLLNLERFFTWPTWAPDGSKIAVSRVRAVDGGSQISLEIIDTSTAQSRTAYENDTGGVVAQGTPHYIYWSPGSRYLSFLASTADGLSLFIKDTEHDSEAVIVAMGAPLYWHWRRDESAIMMHIGRDLELATVPFTRESRNLVSSISPFRAPAISPDGTQFIYIRVEDASSSLIVAPIDTPEEGTKLLDVGPFSAFAWSPDGTEIAVADQQDSRTTGYRSLVVVSANDGTQTRTIAQESFLAFFWSPQGNRLAWVGFDPAGRTFEWSVGEKSGESGDSTKRLFKFQPASDMITMLSFFDQYAYSNSPWSPDGTRLVVAGTTGDAARPSNGHSATGDRIFVLDATGGSPPLDIAGGTLAFWSWN